MISFILLSSIPCVMFVLYKCVNFLWISFKLSHIPGPLWLPLKLLFADAPETIKYFSEMKEIYGDFYKMWFGSKLYFYISKPEHLKVILNHENCLEKGSDYKFIRHHLGNGLVTAPVDIWKAHRKMINPSFSQTLLISGLSVINKSADNLIEILKQNCEQSRIFKDATNCFLDATLETMCQFQLDALKNSSSFSYAIKFLEETAISRIFKFWLQPEFLFKISKRYDKYLEYKKTTNELALNVFNNKISATRDELQDRCFFARLSKYYRDNQLSKEDFLDQIKNLAAAGADTSASGICFCLTFMGMHEEIQNKVYKEIVENIARHEVTVEDLQNLKYTECVIKESLRIAPVVLFVGRKTTDDIELDKYTIPKDSEIFISILDLHRDATYWPDPLKFDPDRFLPENSSKIYPYSYLPFSAGPRNCIGQRHGIISMKIVLAHLVRYFKISTSYNSVEEIEFLPHIVTEPKNGFKINLEKRSSNYTY